nr:putative RNA-directed DNA polymerase [Tanacetum cinerariifolium]
LVQRGLQAQVRVVRINKGTEFLNQTLQAYFAVGGILHQTSVARTPEQNGVVERRNRTLVEAARTMLSAAKVPLLVFNKRTRVIMESIHVNFDELPQMASAHNSSDPAPTCQTMASVQISSDPAPECQTMALNHDSLSPVNQRQANVPQADRIITTSNKLDLLFSPMFDELINGSSKVVSKRSAVSATDAPNHRQHNTTPLNIHTTHAPTCQAPPLAPTVISTRRQLELDAEMCMFALTVSRTKPKNIKEAMADSAWIESMLEELHRFDRLYV